MNNFIESIKKLFNKFKSLSKGVKIAIVGVIVTFIIAIASVTFYSSANKYQLLFSGLDAYDAQMVAEKLKEQKVDVKIQGDSILVPKDMVDELRLSIAPDLTSGSKGYELMDSGSSFGMTDEEFQLKKIRMLQGELEKTIKSFPQISDARVHITAAKDSVFVDDSEPGKAAVYVKLASSAGLSNEQVESIIALVSGSTENIPKENIEVIDQNMNLLSKNISSGESGYVGSESISSHLELEKKYEGELQSTVTELLESIVGKNKVKVAINADLDFDSKEKTETVVDPNKVIVSQQSVKEENGDSTTNTSGGTVDENMSNTITETEESADGSTSLREEQTTNYEVGKSESKIISAPGEVRRLTASVIVDGELQANMQTALENAVANAVGLNTERGDQISVVGIAFDPTMTTDDTTNPFEEETTSNPLYMYLGIGAAGALVASIIAFIIIRRRKKKKVEEPNLLDVVIDDKISNMPEEMLKPIDFEPKNPQAHVESEIKRYASEKPEQVVDIIKSWLVESER